MSLLSGLFSYADTQKRKLGGLLSNPLETLALGGRRFAEDQQASNNLIRNAYPMAGDRTVLNTPEQRGLLQTLAANEAADMGAVGMTRKAPWQPWNGAPRASGTPGMTAEQAQRIVANADYLPWDQVSAAKKVLGIKEQTAAEIWAEMLAAKNGKP